MAGRQGARQWRAAMGREARGAGAAASRCAARGAGVIAPSRGLPRLGLPDAAPCAAMRGARRRPRKTLSVCYLPSHAPRRWCGGASREARRPSFAPYRNGTRAWNAARSVARGVRDAKPRTAPMARRRDGDIAPYRQAARGVGTATGRTRRERGNGARGAERGEGVRARTCGCEGARVRGWTERW